MSQVSVLIISDDSEFSQTIMARWQGERSVPAFLLMSTPAWSETLVKACDFAIIGPAPIDAVAPVLRGLDKAGLPVLCVSSESGARLREAHSRIMLLREHEGWVDTVIIVAGEVVRRLEASARARRAEQARGEAEMAATLGRYVLEMRHSLNNALTSVLGNSELLLLEPGELSAASRDQISTIHSMAVRIHEILQRLNSMELEMKICGGASHSEMHPVPTVPSRVITPVQERGVS